MSLLRTRGLGHPNVFPSCGGMPLLSRLSYISRMRDDIFQSLTRSAVASGFRWVPEGASSSGRWVGKLWGSFFELCDRIPISHPLLITLSTLAGADQDPPPQSLIDSMLLAVPVASPPRLLSVALEAGEAGVKETAGAGPSGVVTTTQGPAQADREGPGTKAGRFAIGGASPTLVINRSPVGSAEGEAASPGGGSPVDSPLSGVCQQARAEMEGRSPEGREREVKGVVVEAERVVADSSPSVRGSAGCTQMSSVSGGETAPSSGRTSGETGLVDPPSPSSVIIPDSSGSEESLALVINRIERIPLPEGRMGGGRLVAGLPNAPEGATTAVNPLLEDGTGLAEGEGSGAVSGTSSLEGGTTSGRLESASVTEGVSEAGRLTMSSPALESPGMGGRILLGGLLSSLRDFRFVAPSTVVPGPC